MDGSLQSFQIFVLLVVVAGVSAYAGWHFSRRRAVRFFGRIISELEGALHLKELEGIALRASVADKEAIAGQLDDAYRSLGDLTASFFDAERKLETKKEELELESRRIEALEQAQALTLEELDTERMRSLQFESRCEQIPALEAELGQAREEYSLQSEALRQARAEMVTLGKTLEAQEHETLRLMGELEAAEALRSEITARNQEIEKLRSRILELEPLQFINEELRREIASPSVARRYFSDDGVMHQIKYALSTNEAEPVQSHATMVDIEEGTLGQAPQISAADLAPGQDLAAERRAEDLKIIPGIGPAIEKLLRENGINSVRQIAEWQEADIQHFEKLLKSNRGRIRRDDWVGGARACLDLQAMGTHS